MNNISPSLPHSLLLPSLSPSLPHSSLSPSLSPSLPSAFTPPSLPPSLSPSVPSTLTPPSLPTSLYEGASEHAPGGYSGPLCLPREPCTQVLPQQAGLCGHCPLELSGRVHEKRSHSVTLSLSLSLSLPPSLPPSIPPSLSLSLSLSLLGFISCFFFFRVDSTSVTSRELIRLQNIPVKAYENTLDILKLENFPKVRNIHSSFQYSVVCAEV